MKKNLTRRSFVGVAGTAAATAGLAGCAPTTQTSVETDAATPEVDLTGWEEVAPLAQPDPTDDLEMLRIDMSFNELEAIRRAAIDACEDVTREDGTVVPKVFVQFRELVEGLGGGTNTDGDQGLDGVMMLCNNDEEVAFVYVNTPIGKRFTTIDAAVSTGLSEEKCKEALDLLTFNGAMLRANHAGINFYNHQRVYHGIVESSMNLYDDPAWIPSLLAMVGDDPLPGPNYYPVPVGKEIMVDGRIYAYDDIEGLINRHERFAVSPCQCVYLGGYDPSAPSILDHEACKDHILPDGVHLEKCLTFGEEAAFYIEQGIGREVTADEMRELVKRGFEENCVLQSCYTKYSEVICTCNFGVCGILNAHAARGTEASTYASIAHNNLMYKVEDCTKCGLCATRCPMQAIEMDSDGYPAVTGVCVRCGQCCYKCPADARKLMVKDEELILEMPDDLVDWNNMEAVYRYEKGMWPKA